VDIQNKLFSRIRQICFPSLPKNSKRWRGEYLKAFTTLAIEGIYTQMSGKERGPPKQEGGLQQLHMVLAPIYLTEDS